MPVTSKPTQAFVSIKEIRDGAILMKDGSMRGILLASSLNFALKSADAQEAIILQFQNFLNSLDFSVQIFVQSRKLDIRPYLALLEERYKEQVGDLLKIQTREYIGFIRNFTESANIMSKSFFVVVPFAPTLMDQKKGGLLKGVFGGKQTSEERTEAFEENRSQLEQRLAVVEQGLIRCGIRAVKLGTEEIVELFYKLFNPGETEKPMQMR